MSSIDMQDVFRIIFNPSRPRHMSPIQDLQNEIQIRCKVKICEERLVRLIFDMNKDVIEFIDKQIALNGAGTCQYYVGVSKRDCLVRFGEHKKKHDHLEHGNNDIFIYQDAKVEKGYFTNFFKNLEQPSLFIQKS
jgi:hypothetical protein